MGREGEIQKTSEFFWKLGGVEIFSQTNSGLLPSPRLVTSTQSEAASS